MVGHHHSEGEIEKENSKSQFNDPVVRNKEYKRSNLKEKLKKSDKM